MSARSLRRPFLCLGLAIAAMLSGGCNPLAAVYFLFLLPPPKVPAECEALEDQRVVVFAYAGRSAQFEYSAIDSDLAKGVLRELRDNVDDIELADPNEVRQWRDVHSDFELIDIGREFKATRVLYLEIQSFSLYEEHSSELYRGTAKIHVQVADVEKDGEIIYETYVESTFPGNRPIPASDVSRDKFRLIYLKHLTREVSRNFFGYRPDEGFTIN